MVLSKNEALSFHKRFFDDNIDEECYGEESCDFEEVVEKFHHSEQSVGIACYRRARIFIIQIAYLFSTNQLSTSAL